MASALHELRLEWQHHQVRGAVAPSSLQFQRQLARDVAMRPLDGRRPAGDVAARCSSAWRSSAPLRTAACRLKPCMADAGADTFVAGSAIFGQKDYRKVVNTMRGALAG